MDPRDYDDLIDDVDDRDSEGFDSDLWADEDDDVDEYTEWQDYMGGDDQFDRDDSEW